MQESGWATQLNGFFFENESERKFGRKRDEKNKDNIIMHDGSSVCLQVNFVCIACVWGKQEQRLSRQSLTLFLLSAILV